MFPLPSRQLRPWAMVLRCSPYEVCPRRRGRFPECNWNLGLVSFLTSCVWLVALELGSTCESGMRPHPASQVDPKLGPGHSSWT